LAIFSKDILSPECFETWHLPRHPFCRHKLAAIDQFVVLIHDLNRRPLKTAIETLEAIRLFVLTARTAFVVAATR
jgi:hypothetical protein